MMMTRSIQPAYVYIYDSFNGKTEIFTWMFFDEVDLCIFTLNAQFDNLWYFEIKADSPFVTIAEM